MDKPHSLASPSARFNIMWSAGVQSKMIYSTRHLKTFKKKPIKLNFYLFKIAELLLIESSIDFAMDNVGINDLRAEMDDW